MTVAFSLFLCSPDGINFSELIYFRCSNFCLCFYLFWFAFSWMISLNEVGMKSAHLKQLWINKLKWRGDFMTIFGYLGSCPCALLWRVKMCTYLETHPYPLMCLCGKVDLLSFSSEEGPLVGHAWKIGSPEWLSQMQTKPHQNKSMFSLPSTRRCCLWSLEQRSWSIAFEI